MLSHADGAADSAEASPPGGGGELPAVVAVVDEVGLSAGVGFEALGARAQPPRPSIPPKVPGISVLYV